MLYSNEHINFLKKKKKKKILNCYYTNTYIYNVYNYMGIISKI